METFTVILHSVFLISVCSGAINSGTPLNTMLGMMLREQSCQDFWFDNDYDYSPGTDPINCGGQRCQYPSEVCMIKTFSSIDTNGVNDRDDYKCKTVSRACMSALGGSPSSGSSGAGFQTNRPVKATSTARPNQGGSRPVCGTRQARGLSCQSFAGPQCDCPSGQSCYTPPGSADFGNCRAPTTTGGGGQSTSGSEKCNLNKDSGRFAGRYSRMWYFDRQQNECMAFWYGGRAGNENRFSTKQECLNLCKSNNGGGAGPAPAPVPRPTQAPQSQSDCTSPSKVGQFCPGKQGNWQRPLPWTFQNGACKQFWYAGCQGNDNRYNTRAECQQACSGNSASASSGNQNSGSSGSTSGGKCKGGGRFSRYSRTYFYNVQRRQCIRGTGNRQSNTFTSYPDCIRACQQRG